MPYERVPRIAVDNETPLKECRDCPRATAVCATGNAALAELRKTYGDTPSYAETGTRTFWITRADHERLLEEDPHYAELVRTAGTAGLERRDMTESCPKTGNPANTPEGEAYGCRYQPTEGISDGNPAEYFQPLAPVQNALTIMPQPGEHRTE